MNFALIVKSSTFEVSYEATDTIYLKSNPVPQPGPLVLQQGAVSLSTTLKTASYMNDHDENADENESGSDGAEIVGFLTQENEGDEIRGRNF